MRIHDLNKVFYHGSYDSLPIGTILTPRTNYSDNWGNTDFYKSLEFYRPQNMLAHNESVFMVSDEDDIDLAGGATEWIFTVKPLGIVQKHDLNWSSEISSLISMGHKSNSDEIRNAAQYYWSGKPHHDENVWEYLTPSAKILSVDKY